MQGLLARRITGPHCHLPAVLQQSSANPQPILMRSRGFHCTLLDIDNVEPDNTDAWRGYVSYRTSTLKTIPGSWCGVAAITEVHGHGRKT